MPSSQNGEDWMSEQNDFKILKRNLPEKYDRFDRIENIVVFGMPDINGCIEGNEFWIEQKSPTEPKRSTTRLFGSNHKISAAQINWFKRQTKSGGLAYVLIGTDKRWLLIGQEFINVINDMTLDQLINISIWNTKKPARKLQWKKLRMILSSKPNHMPIKSSA